MDGGEGGGAGPKCLRCPKDDRSNKQSTRCRGVLNAPGSHRGPDAGGRQLEREAVRGQRDVVMAEML